MINIHLKNDHHDEVKELLKTSPHFNKKFEVSECDCECEKLKCDFMIYCHECEDDLPEKDNVYYLDLDELRTTPREAVFSLLSSFPTFWVLDYKIFITIT